MYAGLERLPQNALYASCENVISRQVLSVLKKITQRHSLKLLECLIIYKFLTLQVSVAGGLGIAASSPARLNTPGRGLVSEPVDNEM